MIFSGTGDVEVEITGEIKALVLENVTVTNDTALRVAAGQSVSIKNVTFEKEVSNYGHVFGDVTFTDCTFEDGFHIDNSGADANVTFEGCTFADTSWIKFGGSGKYRLTDCTVETFSSNPRAPWGPQWLVTYCDTYLKDCDLGRLVRAGATAITITLDNCTYKGEAATVENALYHYEGKVYNTPTVVVK